MSVLQIAALPMTGREVLSETWEASDNCSQRSLEIHGDISGVVPSWHFLHMEREKIVYTFHVAAPRLPPPYCSTMIHHS